MMTHFLYRPQHSAPSEFLKGSRRFTERRSSILFRIDAKFLHSRKEGRAIHSQACGSTIGTADAPLACSERPYNLIALPSFILVSNAGYVGLRICSFSDVLDVMLLGMREGYRIRFSEFSERRVQRPAARQ